MTDKSTGKKLHNPKSHAPAVFIPCWLSQVPMKLISSGAKIIYGRISQWSNDSGKVFRSCPQLSSETGIPIRSVERYIKELKDCDLIGTYHPQAGGLNHFEFYDHPWMHEQINSNMCYSTTTPPNVVLNSNDTANPPTNASVPPDKCVGTPPTNASVINRKEIIINTTTTRHRAEIPKNDPEPVVVSSLSSLILTPQTPNPLLTRDESSSTEFLIKLYEDHPFVTNDIIGLEDFISAAYWLIRNKGDMLLNRRKAGIRTLVESGRFEGDEDWIKSRRREKNRAIGDAQQKAIEQQMRDKVTSINKNNSVASPKCLSSVLTHLTGDANYKKNKEDEEKRQLRIKNKLQEELDRPKEHKPFTRVRLPEELRELQK